MQSSFQLKHYIKNNSHWYGSPFYLTHIIEHNKHNDFDHVQYRTNVKLNTSYQPITSLSLKNNQLKIDITISGLIGEQAVLPLADREVFYFGDRQLIQAVSHFYQIFNHKIIELFYQSWCGNRLVHTYNRKNNVDKNSINSPVKTFLMANAGIDAIDSSLDAYLIAQGLQLRASSMSANILECLFCDYFNLPLKIKTMVGEYQLLPPHQRVTLSTGKQQLASNFTLGKQFFMSQHKIAFNVGPIDYHTFKQFWPGDTLLVSIREFITKLVPAHLSVDLIVEIINKKIPKMQFNKALRLGLNTFVDTHYANKAYYRYQMSL